MKTGIERGYLLAKIQIQKPTSWEKQQIALRLQKKYPKMFGPNKETPADRKKRGGVGGLLRVLTGRASKKKVKPVENKPQPVRTVEYRLKRAGLSDSDIAKLKGKKK